MKKVQVGFIGAGNFVSAHHLLTVRDSQRMDIRAIADLDEGRLKQHASRMPIGYTTADYKKVLADPEIDLVIIGTKQDLHARMIIETLDAGKWAFCEKPMAETAEETQAVLAAERRAKGRLAVGFNRRFAPAYAQTKELFKNAKTPIYIDYVLMYPNPHKGDNFYSKHERILYEGCHILDFVCWFLGQAPKKVFMTGDRYCNNCCILEYPDGSQVSFMCGSMGSYCFGKEHMTVYSTYQTVDISDFVDMRVRGIKGEFDRSFPGYLGEHAEAINKYGYDFFEMYKTNQIMTGADGYKAEYDMTIEEVRRPYAVPFKINEYKPVNPDLWGFVPDKGWVTSLEHFAECLQTGAAPMNADARAGALSTNLALTLLKSLEMGQAVEFKECGD